MLNLDTHILLHALAGSLSNRETELLSQDTWSISAITIWEISKLVQLERVELDLDSSEFSHALAAVHIWPITLPVCCEVRHLDFRGDPADELIAATSVVHRVPLVTRDRVMLRSRRVPLAR